MARYIGPVCRLCRREGMKLFLKGERCYTEKCAIEKRNLPPGQHGKPRKAKMVGYGLQLREKQKVKRIYGVLENQFRRYFETAARHARRHRRDAAAAARAPPRQRRLPPRLRHVAAAGAAAGAPRPLPGQRQEGRHPVVRGEDGRRGRVRASQREERGDPARDRGGQGTRRARVAPGRRRQHARAASPRSRRANRSTCRCRNSSSSSCTRSNGRRHDLAEAPAGASPLPAASRICGGRQGPTQVRRPSQGRPTERSTRHAVERFPAAQAARVRARDGHRPVRPLLRAAVRARLRHDHRQHAAPRAALLDRGRGRHRGQDRRRAARVLADPGRGRGRDRHHPQPEADPDQDAHRRR